MHFQQKQNRTQIQLLSLAQMVAKDRYARVIDAFVDTVDFKTLDFTNSKHKETYLITHQTYSNCIYTDTKVAFEVVESWHIVVKRM